MPTARSRAPRRARPRRRSRAARRKAEQSKCIRGTQSNEYKVGGYGRKPIQERSARGREPRRRWRSPSRPLAQVSVAEGVHAGELAVPVNKSQVLRTDRPYSKALIGNPEIADVLPLTDSSLYVLGKKTGTTSLTLYDRSNRLIAVLDVVVGPDVMTLKRQLSELMPGDDVSAPHRRTIRSCSKASCRARSPPTARSRSPRPMRRARSSTCSRSARPSRSCSKSASPRSSARR